MIKYVYKSHDKNKVILKKEYLEKQTKKKYHIDCSRDSKGKIYYLSIDKRYHPCRRCGDSCTGTYCMACHSIKKNGKLCRIKSRKLRNFIGNISYY